MSDRVDMFDTLVDDARKQWREEQTREAARYYLTAAGGCEPSEWDIDELYTPVLVGKMIRSAIHVTLFNLNYDMSVIDAVICTYGSCCEKDVIDSIATDALESAVSSFEKMYTDGQMTAWVKAGLDAAMRAYGANEDEVESALYECEHGTMQYSLIDLMQAREADKLNYIRIG